MEASREGKALSSQHSNSSEEWMLEAAESASQKGVETQVTSHGAKAVATTSGVSKPMDIVAKPRVSDTVTTEARQGKPKSGRPKPFFYKDTLEDSGKSDADSESSEPVVKIYPANSDVLTCRPRSSSSESSFDGTDVRVVAPRGKSSDEDRYMSDPDYFWEADEEEVALEDLRSRYESDR